MFKVEMANLNPTVLQQFDPKEFLPVVVQFKETFFPPSPPNFRPGNWIWEIIN